MINYKDKISVNYEVMLGKPVIKGTRITIELILKKLSEGESIKSVMADYSLTREDVLAALSYSADVIAQEELLVS
ncbi:MAG: DUF433 domain-containing protein [Spirochaetes bacterium]|nr:DUF433 domain-containing protein [Spirochaetota bacterium]